MKKSLILTTALLATTLVATGCTMPGSAGKKVSQAPAPVAQPTVEKTITNYGVYSASAVESAKADWIC